MTTYFVYLMPYTRGGKTCYYCGYTNDPARREKEHRKETRYHWCGDLRVIQHVFFTQPFDSRKEAMRGEQEVKYMTSKQKWAAYTCGRGAGQP